MDLKNAMPSPPSNFNFLLYWYYNTECSLPLMHFELDEHRHGNIITKDSCICCLGLCHRL